MIVIVVSVLITTMLLNMNFAVNTQDFSKYKFNEVKTFNLRTTYYLSEDRTLLCPKYNIDAGEYAPTDKNKIVGTNVKSFSNNFFITNDNKLYIWGLENHIKYVPGYTNRKKVNLIADNVIDAECNAAYTAYINTDNELWIVGSAWGVDYLKFTKVADDAKKVVYFDGLAYINMDNKLCKNAEIIFNDMQLKNAITCGEQKLLLTTNNELYFYGVLDDRYINHTAEVRKTLLNCEENHMIKLKDNIEKVSMDSNIIAALDTQGNVYIWGFFYSNGDENYIEGKIETYYDYKVASNVKDVSVGTYAICMIDSYGKSFAYGINDSLSGMGNSIPREKEYIGLNASEPIRWANED